MRRPCHGVAVEDAGADPVDEDEDEVVSASEPDDDEVADAVPPLHWKWPVPSHSQKIEKLYTEQPGVHAHPGPAAPHVAGHDEDDEDDDAADAENDAVDGGEQVPSHW
jgi:hypothetical protein